MYNQLSNPNDCSLNIRILTTFEESIVMLFLEKDQDHEQILLVSPSVPKENFIELVLFVLSLRFQRIQSIFEDWGPKAQEFIYISKQQAIEQRAKKHIQRGEQFNKKEVKGVATRSMSNNIDHPKNIKRKGYIEMSDSLINEHNIDEFFQGISKWTQIGYYDLGIEFKAPFNVIFHFSHFSKCRDNLILTDF